jgi:CheY-like chemotaxis protein
VKRKALVVTHDLDAIDIVAESLGTLDHDYDTACSHQEAKGKAADGDYSYILLDIHIPARSRTGVPRVQNTENFLEHLIEAKNGNMPPVIVMTDRSVTDLDQTVKVMRLAVNLREKGAVDFIGKPFPTVGRTLDRVIKKVLRTSTAASGVPTVMPMVQRPPNGTDSDETSRGGTRPSPGTPLVSSTGRGQTDAANSGPQPFECGEMVFSPSRVELCEVKICGGPENGMIRRILDELRHTNQHGRFVRYDGEELARRIGCERGQNGVAEAVAAFRTHVCEVMLDEANVKIDRLHDTILNDRRYGYRLSSKITVRDADDPVNEPQSQNRDVVNGPQNDAVNGGDDPENNERQQWALDQMRTGREFRKADIVDQFDCSTTTAERDLRDLRRRGLIEFVGPAKTGYWRPVR